MTINKQTRRRYLTELSIYLTVGVVSVIGLWILWEMAK